MKASEVMTGDVEVVNPGNSLRQAAERMRRLDTGKLPVCDGCRTGGKMERNIKDVEKILGRTLKHEQGRFPPVHAFSRAK